MTSRALHRILVCYGAEECAQLLVICDFYRRATLQIPLLKGLKYGELYIYSAPELDSRLRAGFQHGRW